MDQAYEELLEFERGVVSPTELELGVSQAGREFNMSDQVRDAAMARGFVYNADKDEWAHPGSHSHDKCLVFVHEGRTDQLAACVTKALVTLQPDLLTHLYSTATYIRFAAKLAPEEPACVPAWMSPDAAECSRFNVLVFTDAPIEDMTAPVAWKPLPPGIELPIQAPPRHLSRIRNMRE